MKNIVLSFSLILLSTALFSQVWKSSENKIHFFSEAPLENIEATNTNAIALYNEENRQLAMVIPIKGFKFEKELMEEHFNENYMESEKFKNGKFKGTLDKGLDLSKDGTYETSATGVLTIHGVEQKRTLKGTLIVKDGVLLMKTKFQIKLEDHDVEIPKIVFSNIAEVIDVTCDFTFKPQPKKK